MSAGRLAAAAIAFLLGASMLVAQERDNAGPTIVAARAAFFTPFSAGGEAHVAYDAPAACGSSLKNAVMLALGFSLAVGALELTYTLMREPFVRRGRDLPPADPVLIAWAGGAGFALGLVGTEMCRRRRR